MDEYVDRKAFENVLKIADAIAAANGKDKDRRIWARAICLLHDMPTADVAPVVHGRWVTHYRSGTPVAGGDVSTCCDMWNNRKSDYCPNCGAKIDGGDSDAKSV